MIPESGPGLTLIMLIVLPFVWSTPLGLVAAELGSARPQEGGYYKWVQEACGEFWGFQAGWWRTISIYIDNTLYVILAGGYVANTWNLSWGAELAFKIGMILVFTYINIRGVKDVGIVSSVLAVLVIIAFAMVAICGFMNWTSNPFVPFTADGEIMGLSGIAGAEWIYYIGMGIAIGMWMYSGYESMSTIAGEVTNPQVIPKATLITVPLITSDPGKMRQKAWCSLRCGSFCGRREYHFVPVRFRHRSRSRCIPAGVFLRDDLHFRYDSTKKDSGRGAQVQDPRRLWLPYRDLYRALPYRILFLLYQWNRVLYGRHVRYHNRTDPVHHLEKDVRRPC